MNSLTHFDAQGQAHMVDVAAKASTHRIAVAGGRIEMRASTLAIIEAGTASKGDVLGIARLAGIMAAKKTSDLIPLCHPLALTRIAIDFNASGTGSAGAASISCTATVETPVHGGGASLIAVPVQKSAISWRHMSDRYNKYHISQYLLMFYRSKRGQ